VIILKNEKLNLSNTQKEILTALVNMYQKKGSAVKNTELTELINNRSPGTIRNLMQTMRALMLVKGIPGEKGGYLPTELAFETLGFGQEAEEIPIYRNEKISDVTFQEMRLRPPNSSILYVLGDMRDFKVGDKIKIASRKLIISGIVEGRNDLNNSILSSIEIAFLRK
jgi:predicted transcriptional regulator